MFPFFKRSQSANIDLSFLAADMHSHLLPGLDDGLETVDETIHFIQRLHQAGYRKLICTPHIFDGMYNNSPSTVLPVLEKVRADVKKNNIDIVIEAAAEYMIDHEFEQTVANRKPLLTFGDHYILVEMSYIAASPFLEKVVFDLKVLGLKPILAHPERYTYYHNNFEQYKNLKDRGCLLQLNLLSLSGYYGKPVKKIAEQLLAENMIDFAGTDMHHQAHMDMLFRYVSTKEFQKLLGNYPLKNASLV
ncbi:MAG: histidinol phosphatase [Bacteroidota bacterium]|nr:histidinol phosphatase [Bacteroidota bacterium]